MSKRNRLGQLRYWAQLSEAERNLRCLSISRRYKPKRFPQILPPKEQAFVDRVDAHGIVVIDMQPAVGKGFEDMWVFQGVDTKSAATAMVRFNVHAKETGFYIYELVARTKKQGRFVTIAILLGPRKTDEEETEEIRRGIEAAS